jgi:serine/threonine-protein kinase
VSADFGALAQVLERAARPDPAERFTPREFGQALVKAAEQMPRPTPVEIVTAPVRDASGAISAPIPVPGSVSPPRSTRPAPPPVAFSPPRAEPGAPITIRTGPASATADPSVPEGVSVARDDTPTGPLQLGLEGTGPVVLDLDELHALAAGDPTGQTVAPKKARWGLRFAVLGLVLALLGGGGVIAYNTVLNPANPVPTLVGLTEGEARNEVSQFGWQVVILKERSDDVDAGEVIRTDPVSGESLKKRDSLTMYISEGPTFSTLEDVSGKTEQEARTVLEGLGLAVTTSEVNDETVPVGAVVSWEVPDQPTLRAGDQLVKGSTVNIVLSLGPAQRPMPVLVGLTIQQATDALTAAGLTIVVGPAAPHPTVARGLVSVQSVPANTLVDKGTSVTVGTSTGQVPTQIPYIYGKDFATVSRRLTEAGLVVGTVTGNQSRGLTRASIGGARVNYRQRVFKGSVVDLVFP